MARPEYVAGYTGRTIRRCTDTTSTTHRFNAVASPLENGAILRDQAGIAVAPNRSVGRLQRPGQPLRCSAGASALPYIACLAAGRVERHSLPRHVLRSFQLPASSFQLLDSGANPFSVEALL